jgi:hypothetical protein
MELVIILLVQVIKSRMMKWVVHVACIGEINSYRTLAEKPKGKKSTRKT